MKRVVAIIQARMTSTRLPGKVLMPVLGRPLLEYQLERVRLSSMVDDIVIATTVNAEDDPVATLARKEGVGLYRGSELDVLDRYYKAALSAKADHVMRLTADCPFVEPELCDSIISQYFDSRVDYVHTGATFAEGLDCEIFSFEALKAAWQDASLPSEREHATMFLHNNPGRFSKLTHENSQDDSRLRLTVDETEDFAVVKKVLESLYPLHGAMMRIAHIKEFLAENPDVFEINSHVTRNEGLAKSLEEDVAND